jgi:hypothetical protein
MTDWQELEDTGTFKRNPADFSRGLTVKPKKRVAAKPSAELRAMRHLLNAVRKLTQAVQDQRADIADLRALLEHPWDGR